MKNNKKTEQSQYERMTTGNEGTLIIKLAIPSIMTMLVTNIYNMADTAFVGTLGTSASGAVGVIFGFMSILQAIGFLYGQGAGSILSRALGQQLNEDANKAASTGIFFSFITAAIITVLSTVFMDPLIRMLGSTETIAPYAKTYISYILVSAPFIATSFTINNVLRYEGRALLGTIGLMTGGILNIFGDILLIFGFKMGIAGAGLATCVSQIISFCILMSMFIRKKSQIELTFKNVSRDAKYLFDVVTTGLPSMLRQGLGSIAVIILNMLAGPYGDAAIAAMSIVSRVVFFVFSITLGLGQGYQPVCGFNYGAKKYDRVYRAYKFVLLAGEVSMAVLAAIAFLVSKDIIKIFRDDPEVIEIGTRALRLQLLTQLAIPISVMSEMTLQSTGKRVQAIILSSVRSGLILIPALYILATLRGLSGIQEAQPLTNILGVIPAIFFIKRFFAGLKQENSFKFNPCIDKD